MSQQSIQIASLPSTIKRAIHTPDKITEIQLMFVRGEQVPLKELPNLNKGDREALESVGVKTVKELIFCSNKRLSRAFGGNGNGGTKKRIRIINATLNELGFPRRMSVSQFKRRIEELGRYIVPQY